MSDYRVMNVLWPTTKDHIYVELGFQLKYRDSSRYAPD